jgi:hypothetical protein
MPASPSRRKAAGSPSTPARNASGSANSISRPMTSAPPPQLCSLEQETSRAGLSDLQGVSVSQRRPREQRCSATGPGSFGRLGKRRPRKAETSRGSSPARAVGRVTRRTPRHREITASAHGRSGGNSRSSFVGDRRRSAREGPAWTAQPEHPRDSLGARSRSVGVRAVALGESSGSRRRRRSPPADGRRRRRPDRRLWPGP